MPKISKKKYETLIYLSIEKIAERLTSLKTGNSKLPPDALLIILFQIGLHLTGKTDLIGCWAHVTGKGTQ